MKERFLKTVLLDGHLPDAVRTELLGTKALPGLSVRTYSPGEVLEGALYLTDREGAPEGLAVLGISKGPGSLSYRHLYEYDGSVTEGLTAEYLERIYRRKHGIPWEILETEHCILRETDLPDLDAFYEIYKEPQITAYMEDLFDDRAKEEAYTLSYRENIYGIYGFGVWTVVLKETGEVIGRAGLSYRAGFEEPELGFVIAVPRQRQGLGYEVCSACLSYGRKELGFESVISLVCPGNAASAALLRKLGMEKKESVTQAGQWYDIFRISF